MESTITADAIYGIFLRLKREGLTDIEIKKNLYQIFFDEKEEWKSFKFEKIDQGASQPFFSKNVVGLISLALFITIGIGLLYFQ